MTKSARSNGDASLGSCFFGTTEGALGLSPVLPLPAGRSEVLGSEVNLPHALREEGVTGDSASVGTEAGRACLRVTTGASEARGGFGEGSTRSEKVRGGSASSRR